MFCHVSLLLPLLGGANPWPMIVGDPIHSGRNAALQGKSPWDAPDAKPVVKWKYKAAAEAESSIVLSDTSAFGAGGSTIFAIDKATGKQKWTFKSKNNVLASGVLSGGLYMVGSDAKTFYALDQETGKLVWSFKAKGEFTGGAAVDEVRKVVYVGSGEGLHAYSLEGKEIFKIKASGVNGSPAVDAEGNVLFGDDLAKMWKVDSSGKVLWTHSFKEVNSAALGIRSPIVITAEGDLLLSGGDPDGKRRGHIVRMDSGGKVLWASHCDGDKNWCQSCWTAPAQVGDVVVAGCGLDTLTKGTIWGLNKADGKVVWKIIAKNDCQTSSPVRIGDGSTLVLGCTDGTLYAVNAEDGKTVWTWKAGKGIWATPAVDSDGSIIVGSHDGFVYSLSPGGKAEL